MKLKPKIVLCNLNLCFAWQGRQDSNLQPTVLETATLPIEPRPYLQTIGKFNKMVAGEGLEPPTQGV